MISTSMQNLQAKLQEFLRCSTWNSWSKWSISHGMTHIHMKTPLDKITEIFDPVGPNLHYWIFRDTKIHLKMEEQTSTILLENYYDTFWIC